MLSRVFTTREQILMLGCAAAICIGGITYAIANSRTPAVVDVRERQIPLPRKEVEPSLSSLEKAPSASPALQKVPAPSAPMQELVTATPAPPVRHISVSVTGAVQKPGMYEFDEGDRVDDAVTAAGGATARSDMSDINRAAKLIDGSALVIPLAATAGLDGKRLVLRSGQDAASLNPREYTISGWKGSAAGSVAAKAGASSAPAAASVATGNGTLDLNTATLDELETLPGLGPKLAGAIVEYRTRQPFQSVDDLDNVPGFGTKRVADLRPHVTVNAH